MRDITALHPKLQEIIPKLKEECKKIGITIAIGECFRTVAEQDALYAKGRTASGSIVTNCKGSTYSSMHQWGVAFDFYLDMDVDGDGKKSDDAFNNAKKYFQKVGAIGKKLGLEWGGDWKSIVDMPHFQLPDWGSTATKLKNQYGTPEKFMATWKTKTSSKTIEQIAKEVIAGKYGNGSARKKAIEALGFNYEEVQKKVSELLGTKTTTTAKTTVTASKNVAESAKSKDASLAKEYTTTTGLNLRAGAGTGKAVITCMPKGSKVRCYGYYTSVNGVKWLFVQYGKYTGFCSCAYLK